jgi:UDP-N-acetylmuramate dehydrogenase
VVNIEELKNIFRGHVALNEPLNKYTSFRIGGPADYYLEPLDKDDTVRLILYLHQHQIPFTVIGNGSNLLVSDDGIRGAVINFESGLNNVFLEGDVIVAEAGVRLARFVEFCIQHERKGVEMLAGIPGTIGGAVMMNAGAYGGEISDYLEEVEVLREGQVIKVKKSESGFSYRRSGFQRDVILSASFQMPTGDKAEMIRIRRELLVKRNQTQPLNMPNSGSVFKNPQSARAAKLIDEAGLKGTRRGKAMISDRHGNFIVNTGGASANDVLELMRLAKATVKNRFNIMLEPEVKLLGFPQQVMQELYS